MNTQMICERFHDDGFAVARDVFSWSEMAKIQSDLDHCVGNDSANLGPGDIYYEDTPDRPIKSMFRLEQLHETFRALLADTRLIDLVRTIYDDRDPILWTTMYFAKAAHSGSVTRAHQDNAFQCWVPSEALTLTIAVDASTCDNGVLVCQKGSHKLGFLPHQPSGTMGFSQMLIDTPDTEQYPEVEIRMNPGDICLHDIHTIHRSGANTTAQSRRQLGISCRSSRAQVDEQMIAHRERIVEKLHAENSGGGS